MHRIFASFGIIAALASCDASGGGEPSAEHWIAQNIHYEGTMGETVSADNSSITVNGKTYQMSDEAHRSDGFSYEITNDSDSRQVMLSQVGRDVRSVMIGYNELAGGQGDFERFGIVGSPTISMPKRTISYDGTYYSADIGDARVEYQKRDIRMTMDFNTGMLRGNSLNTAHGYEVVINGVLTGNRVELNIEDETESGHKGVGGFFGTGATEFIGGYQESNRIGMIYAQD